MLYALSIQMILKTIINLFRCLKKRTIKNISYWSSSKKTGYNDEANIKIYIKSKNGRDISRVNYEEQEILFMRNSKFRCEDKSVINGICRIFLTEI